MTSRYAFPPNTYQGKLIVLDGMQRSGKSTAAEQIQVYLTDAGIDTVRTEWNSYPTIQPIIDAKKETRTFTPLTWFGLHYVDFLLRYEETIKPALMSGRWVVADRYVYTALTRDYLKGIDRDFIYNAYQFAVSPDLIFFFISSPELVLERHLLTTQTFHPYNSGIDIFGEQGDAHFTYRKYQEALKREYLILSDISKAHIVSGERPLVENSRFVVETVRNEFAEHFAER